MYQQGLSIEEIALQRQLAQSTIFSHIMKLYENGESIDLKQFVNKEDINAVKNAKKELDNPETLKPYFEHFEQALDYNTIKIALTVIDTLDTQTLLYKRKSF
ncbi:helix-turn-helix domain-containing protein [Aquimarina sp. AU58]|uniref:helix-turn-helix domain-containing protein n=1 Tax=Aquimarina sp. AU58 TaxID=1874112 RepID=UPI001F371B2D|nr:helix-turn-helix domain-containing protein [Aquimarina sp. AU58]